MKKIVLSSLIAGLLMANLAGADPVAVKDGAIFIVSNGVLSVQSASDSALPASCGAAPAPVLPMAIANATDVVIDDGKAFVTSTDSVTGEVSVTSVDVSECLSSSCDAEPTVDLNSGVLFIPCLEANGQRYDVTMHQRGNSSNWEVDLGNDVQESVHHHGHDDDDN